jgi:hypothetical protein
MRLNCEIVGLLLLNVQCPRTRYDPEPSLSPLTSVCELFGEKLPGQDRSKLPTKGLRLLEEIAKLPQEKQDKIFKVMITLLEE